MLARINDLGLTATRILASSVWKFQFPQRTENILRLQQEEFKQDIKESFLNTSLITFGTFFFSEKNCSESFLKKEC